jgi:hypothetical protein
MEQQNRILCPISMQPVEQRATTRGTGIRLAEIQKVCFILDHDRYVDTVMADCPHTQMDLRPRSSVKLWF